MSRKPGNAGLSAFQFGILRIRIGFKTAMIREWLSADAKEDVKYTGPVNEWPDELAVNERPSVERATEVITEKESVREPEFGFGFAFGLAPAQAKGLRPFRNPKGRRLPPGFQGKVLGDRGLALGKNPGEGGMAPPTHPRLHWQPGDFVLPFMLSANRRCRGAILLDLNQLMNGAVIIP